MSVLDYCLECAGNKSGVRDFSEQDIAALEFIRCFRSAGISVESLIEYMSLVEEGEGTEKARMKILEEQLEKLISRIAELRAAKERLDYKIENYKKLISQSSQYYTHRDNFF